MFWSVYDAFVSMPDINHGVISMYWNVVNFIRIKYICALMLALINVGSNFIINLYIFSKGILITFWSSWSLVQICRHAQMRMDETSGSDRDRVSFLNLRLVKKESFSLSNQRKKKKEHFRTDPLIPKPFAKRHHDRIRSIKLMLVACKVTAQWCEVQSVRTHHGSSLSIPGFSGVLP